MEGRWGQRGRGSRGGGEWGWEGRVVGVGMVGSGAVEGGEWVWRVPVRYNTDTDGGQELTEATGTLSTTLQRTTGDGEDILL